MNDRESGYGGESWGGRQTKGVAMHIQLGELVQIPGVWEKRFNKLVFAVTALVVVGVLLGAMLWFDDVAKVVAEVIATPSVLTVDD